MNQQPNQPRMEADRWISQFADFLAAGDAASLGSLFHEQSYWRDLSAFTWSISTFTGATMAATMIESTKAVGARSFELDSSLFEPRSGIMAGRATIEAPFRFETDNGPGLGVLRLAKLPDGSGPMLGWTISTLLDMDRIRKERVTPERADGGHTVDFSQPPWPMRRAREMEYDDREPDVLIVGGGHGGVTAAAELKQLGIDALIVDRHPRVGDCWRLRYDGLKLHNKFPVNHFRYMPFPEVVPLYLPKDKVANWIEDYVDALDLNFWPGTPFEGATYDYGLERWSVSLTRPDGTVRTLAPKHIIMATSISGTPNLPKIPTMEQFTGPVIHSSGFGSGKDWIGRSVLVIGSATSAHDICQQLHSHGAKATMVQRSPTLVMSVEPSSELYDGGYGADWPPLDIKDLLSSSVPFPVVKLIHQEITKKVKEIEEPLYSKLRAVNFRLDFGEDDTGWPFKFRNRGGGYYLNVGCSNLIADGEVGLIQADDIQTYLPDGLRLKDGSIRSFDAIILATGFKGHDHLVKVLFGDEVAGRVGQVWGIGPERQELRNMWTKTGQPGLWFTGGAFSMSRIFSRFMALQIDAIETGRLDK